jgi:hypothetical protein
MTDHDGLSERAFGIRYITVNDLAAGRRRLQGLGIVLGDDAEGDYSTLAQMRDPVKRICRKRLS